VVKSIWVLLVHIFFTWSPGSVRCLVWFTFCGDKPFSRGYRTIRSPGARVTVKEKRRLDSRAPVQWMFGLFCCFLETVQYKPFLGKTIFTHRHYQRPLTNTEGSFVKSGSASKMRIRAQFVFLVYVWFSFGVRFGVRGRRKTVMSCIVRAEKFYDFWFSADHCFLSKVIWFYESASFHC
jgi:hypothetical protein